MDVLNGGEVSIYDDNEANIKSTKPLTKKVNFNISSVKKYSVPNFKTNRFASAFMIVLLIVILIIQFVFKVNIIGYIGVPTFGIACAAIAAVAAACVYI